MSIINNAHPGSEIGLLCLIYRVICRNPGKFSEDEITELCQLKNLNRNDNQRKKFPETLSFWKKEEHKLWRVNEKSKLELMRDAKSCSPQDISSVVNEALFEHRYDDILAGNDAEPLFRYLGCFLASDHSEIRSEGLNEFFSSMVSDIKTPNTNERPVLLHYGYFLGFLEKGKKDTFIVDPTRAVRNVIDQVFDGESKLDGQTFFDSLAKRIPLLDGGQYRKQIETKMVGHKSGDLTTNKISKSLSLAIERLKTDRTLSIDEDHSDAQKYYLTSETDGNVPFSHIGDIRKAASQ